MNGSGVPGSVSCTVVYSGNIETAIRRVARDGLIFVGFLPMSRPDESAKWPSDPPKVESNIAEARRQVEALVLAGNLKGAQEAIEAIVETLSHQPGRRSELEAVKRRLQEVSELRIMTDTRLRDHLERGQFYLNRFQYADAIRAWRSDPFLAKQDAVLSRIAFAKAQIDQLEAGVAQVKARINAGDPEGALADLERLKCLDPESTVLWNLKKSAENLQVQKQASSLKDQALRLLEQEDYEAAVTILARIGETSQNIGTVRWLKGVRKETVMKLLAQVEPAIAGGDRARAEKLFRWISRINASDGEFDKEVERLRRDFGLTGVSQGCDHPRPAPVRSAAPVELGLAEEEWSQESLREAAKSPAPRAAPGLDSGTDRERVSGPRATPLPGAAPNGGPSAGSGALAPWLPAKAGALRGSPPPHSRRGVPKALLAALAAVVLLSLLGLEAFSQYQLASADRLRAAGKFFEASQALDRAEYTFFSRKTAHALRRDVEFQSAHSRGQEALVRRNWPQAEEALLEAIKLLHQKPEGRGELEAALNYLREDVTALASRGSLREAWNAYDLLQRLEAHELLAGRGSGSDAYTFTLTIGRTFLSRGGFTEALTAAKRAQRHPLATAEVSKFLDEIRDHVARTVEETVDRDDFGQAQSNYRFLETHFQEAKELRERLLRLVDFGLAAHGAAQAADAGDLQQAMDLYEKALRIRPEGEMAIIKLRFAKNRIEKLHASPPPPSAPTPAQDAAILTEAIEVASQGSYSRLPRRPEETVSQQFNHGYLQGGWTVMRDPSRPGDSILITGRLSLPSGSFLDPVGNVRIGFILTPRRGRTPLAGDVVKVPLLLPGQSHDFEVRLSASGAEMVQVGLDVP